MPYERGAVDYLLAGCVPRLWVPRQQSPRGCKGW